MKVHLPLLLCSLLPLYCLTAQHHIGFSVGPTLTYRTIGTDCSDTPKYADETYSRTPLGVQASLNYGYAITESLRFGFGMQYDRRRYELRTGGLRWGSQHDNNGGFNPCLPGDASAIGMYFTSQFIGIPLMVRYDLGRTKVRPFLSAGLNPSAHLSQTRHISNSFDPIVSSLSRELSPERTFHLYGRVSGGLAMTINPKFSVVGQLVVERDFTAMATSIAEERLYGFSLQIGVEQAL